MAVWALFTFSWQNLIAAAITWWVAGSWGIGMGYHRLLTHKGFKTPKFVEYFLTICGTLGLQSGALNWVTTHRKHHAFTETENDPHSPRIGGAFWAHIGWILQGTAQNQSEELWGIFLRQVIGWHSTWLVNSATHLWGTRRFKTSDDSRNNGLVAALTFGEGWHNNHHANPRSAKHGLAWYEFDVNWIQIKFLEKIGLAKKVHAFQFKDEHTDVKSLLIASESGKI
jgi:stearoyl-CoA desaturase (delta-9 desaturase)